MNDLLVQPVVLKALRQAWQDSKPGIIGGHEEGGFILADHTGAISVTRWQRGTKSHIFIPPHPACRFEGKRVLATFHTHPNTGRTFDPEPSEGDIDGVRYDTELKASHYQGELVISAETIYHIFPDGEWRILTSTEEAFDDSNAF